MRSSKLRTRFEQEALPHLDALYNMALRLTQDPQDAEDLVQDALVKAFRFFHRFQQGTNIRAWLFKVLINTFHNTTRKYKNIKRLQAEAEVDPHYEQFISEASTRFGQLEETVLGRLLADHLMSSIQLLPQDFRLAVILCDFMEFSYKEMAEILDCPVGTVMSRLYRGRRLLQKRLYDLALEHGYVSRQEVLEGDSPPKTADLDAFRRRKGRA